MSDDMVDDHGIHIKVRHGVVYLMDGYPIRMKRRMAEDLVRSIGRGISGGKSPSDLESRHRFYQSGHQVTCFWDQRFFLFFTFSFTGAHLVSIVPGQGWLQSPENRDRHRTYIHPMNLTITSGCPALM